MHITSHWNSKRKTKKYNKNNLNNQKIKKEEVSCKNYTPHEKIKK